LDEIIRGHVACRLRRGPPTVARCSFGERGAQAALQLASQIADAIDTTCATTGPL
jgi:hypothetical protein